MTPKKAKGVRAKKSKSTAMTKPALTNKLLNCEMPNFLLGLIRGTNNDDKHVSHVYRGTFSEVGAPMCHRGYNRGEDGFSIWRNNIGRRICRNCIGNTLKELNRKHDTNGPKCWCNPKAVQLVPSKKPTPSKA